MIAVVGAGFSGAVVARELAEAGIEIELFETRSHVAGNAHTERDTNGVMVHVYGPHIFHTAHEHVWAYVNRFADMVPYVHRVRAIAQGSAYSLPVNLSTINQFFGTNFDEEAARLFISQKTDTSIKEPLTFTDQALKFVGPELFEAFFRNYTEKQWGVSTDDLPASILARLPVRFNKDDSYFNHPYQAIPRNGYTAMVENILDHPLIRVNLGVNVKSDIVDQYQHVFWTGPIDTFFAQCVGMLGYRTLDFERETLTGDFQGAPVVNYCDAEPRFTRITEHKHFAPWETHEGTTIYREYSRKAEIDDIPYYPIRLVRERQLLERYVSLARTSEKVSFLGRLGTYRYIDMDVTIHEALSAAGTFLRLRENRAQVPNFFVDPLQ